MCAGRIWETSYNVLQFMESYVESQYKTHLKIRVDVDITPGH